jgi:hypothetical protein
MSMKISAARLLCHRATSLAPSAVPFAVERPRLVPTRFVSQERSKTTPATRTVRPCGLLRVGTT